jgi:succinyl-CoA:mesaconate CoA transferase
MSALDDLRVLDLTRVLGGPYCTMLFADMGADVVKIEPPGGDMVREIPPFYEDDDEPYGGYFQSINRGKRSLELDFGDEADRQAFLDLVADADVVIENFQAGTMEKFDLHYERLRDCNPGLVYASIRGFGDPRTGETDRQHRPAFDLIAQALSGVMHLNGQPDSPPTKFALGIGDIFTGVITAVGILAALRHRDRTGVGQYVDAAMYDSLVSLAERTVYQYSYTGDVPRRRGNSHPTLFPYDAFETTDGYVVVAALTDDQWVELCETMDRPDLSRYTDVESRLDHRHELSGAIEDWTRRRDTRAVLDCLCPEVPAAPVQDVAEVFDDDHLAEREMFTTLMQPGADEEVTVAGTPLGFSETPPDPGPRAPLLDEHRAELLEELTDRRDRSTGATEAESPSTGGSD